jgi:tetratricopeptide (TPR) repeat protein
VAAREASDLFQRQKAVSNEARAWEILSKSLLAQRKSSAAKEAIDRAAALVTKVGHRLVRVEVEITRARVRAALGQTAEARSSLKDALAQAKTAGFKGAELEAQLALGEVELKAGDISGGRTRLLALEQEAKSRGFGLLAKKAAAQR